jgi:effector-binding domain-containing protein
MRWLKRLFLLLIGLIGAAVGAAFFLPNKAHLERNIVIDRPPAMVFGMLNGFRRFNDWSPWAGLDPNAINTRSGPEIGVGAKFAWKGNSDVGEGSQEIKVSEPYSRIQILLNFGPMGSPHSTYTLVPEGESTRLTWAFDSNLPLNFDRGFGWNLMGRLTGPWVDKWVGKDYERGLASLKTLLEKIPKADITGIEVDVGDVTPRPTYFISTEAALDSSSSTNALMAGIAEISVFATLNALQQAGPPRAVINGHDAEKWQFDVTIPYDRNDAPVAGQLKTGSTHAGKVVLFKHVGSYDTLGDTHEKAHTWLAVNGWKEIGRRSEIYVSDPLNTPEAERLTIIEVPVEP